MLTQLKTQEKVVGAKQTRRAVEGDAAATVFLAEDANERVTAPIEMLCQAHGVPVVRVPTMRQLGEACGIPVGATTAAIVKP